MDKWMLKHKCSLQSEFDIDRMQNFGLEIIFLHKKAPFILKIKEASPPHRKSMQFNTIKKISG